MHIIWNLLRAELSAHAATLRTFAVITAVIVGTNLAMGGATPAIAICVLTVGFLPGLLFAQDERAHLDTMYSILPVTRAQFVVARYLLVVLAAAVAALVGVVVARIDDAVRGPGAGVLPLSTAGVAGLAVAAVGMVAAVQLLLLFSLGHARTGVYAYGATMVLMFGGMFLIERFPDLALTIIRWAGSPWAGAAGPGAAAAVLALSAMGAVRLYRRRSL
ncbi:ABC-2 transporter permease [Actinomyces gerencseriae]|uniref:ABC-2 transporter permease n=1 Tax=Actinomyces gerencseriae TaxID=52769 RepID=UPI00047CEF13|nr:ABC-2 transporter permease [Actinomyces gerencseriae]